MLSSFHVDVYLPGLVQALPQETSSGFVHFSQCEECNGCIVVVEKHCGCVGLQ